MPASEKTKEMPHIRPDWPLKPKGDRLPRDRVENPQPSIRHLGRGCGIFGIVPGVACDRRRVLGIDLDVILVSLEPILGDPARIGSESREAIFNKIVVFVRRTTPRRGDPER